MEKKSPKSPSEPPRLDSAMKCRESAGSRWETSRKYGSQTERLPRKPFRKESERKHANMLPDYKTEDRPASKRFLTGGGGCQWLCGSASSCAVNHGSQGTSPVILSQALLWPLDLCDSMGHSQKFGTLRDSSASRNPNVPLHRIDSLALGGGLLPWETLRRTEKKG